jgi:vacuolar protein sorting-associated protein 13D
VATLPKLNLHFNESKILAVQSVMNSFLSPKTGQPADSDGRTEKMNVSFLSGSQINLHDGSFDLNSTGANLGPRERTEKNQQSPKNIEKSNNCKIFLAQFTIQQVAVEIQSRGRSIAELQISGARTTVTKRAVDTSVSFVIHSLLLADAVQTFGPDFELLLASHKHVR